MTVLQECPVCRKRQGLNKKLYSCGEALQKARKSERVKFFVDYYKPDGKARREFVGTSLETARTRFAKIQTDKRERPDTLLVDPQKTFADSTEWYLGLEKVKSRVRF